MYVGAIAILFLFVIMMLNLTDFGNTVQDMSNYMPAGFVVGVVVFFWGINFFELEGKWNNGGDKLF